MFENLFFLHVFQMKNDPGNYADDMHSSTHVLFNLWKYKSDRHNILEFIDIKWELL